MALGKYNGYVCENSLIIYKNDLLGQNQVCRNYAEYTIKSFF